MFSIIRFSNHARVLEPLFVFTMAYLSYLTAEIFHMSGILAITFCGITMKNYVERNVATKSQTTIKYAIKMLSSSSETIIFMFLGVATIHDNHNWNWWFVTFTIIFCTLFRFDVNYFKLLLKSHRCKFHHQFYLLCYVPGFSVSLSWLVWPISTGFTSWELLTSLL